MRLFWVLIGCLILAQCASRGRLNDEAGAASKALVIIGVAESSSNMAPRYSMLWRRLDTTGAFLRFDAATSIDARTNANGVRVHGIPGEFVVAEVEPGVYALDGVFAVIRDRTLNYAAEGVITGPDRPAFEVGAGDAVYLGIWEMNLVDQRASTRLWRLDAADAHAVVAALDRVVQVRVAQTHTRAVACNPHRYNTTSIRQIC